MPTLRPVRYAQLVRVFERDGFTFRRQRGDHLIYTKPGVKRPLVIPMYQEIPGGAPGPLIIFKLLRVRLSRTTPTTVKDHLSVRANVWVSEFLVEILLTNVAIVVVNIAGATHVTI